MQWLAMLHSESEDFSLSKLLDKLHLGNYKKILFRGVTVSEAVHVQEGHGRGSYPMPSRDRRSGMSSANPSNSSSSSKLAWPSSIASCNAASCWSRSPNSAIKRATSSLLPVLRLQKKEGHEFLFYEDQQLGQAASEQYTLSSWLLKNSVANQDVDHLQPLPTCHHRCGCGGDRGDDERELA